MPKKELKLTKKRIAWLITVVILAILVYRPLYAEVLKDAIRDDNVNRVILLLSLPGDVNYRIYAPAIELVSDLPLDVACRSGNYKMMNLLLKNGASPSNIQGVWQPLEHVLGGDYKGLYERVELLINAGADVNITGNIGRPVILGLVLKQYSDPLIKEEANAEVLKTLIYLVEHGADVKPGYPAYRYLPAVVENENYGVLEYLLSECDLDVNEQYATGETPLMRAVKLGNLEMVDFLLGFGADASIRDNDGKTALDYAKENDYSDIVEHFEEIQLD